MKKLNLILPKLHTRFFSSSPSFEIKNVTQTNFEAALRDLRVHVSAADFIAIDLEMTGVNSAPWRESFEFDRFDIRYFKVRDSANKFAVLQFGVCPFRWDKHNKTLLISGHNFFIFPRQEIPGMQSPEFLCQTSSIDFLARYQFDLNMCIREVILQLSRRSNHLVLGVFTSRQFQLIKLVTKEIKDVEYICVPSDTCSPQHLVVYTDTAEDRELLRREVLDCQRDGAKIKIKAATGFRQVIDLLSSEKKLIVGHHCFLDIAQVYSKFIGPLPSTLEEYAAGVHEYFPYIIDTKVLLSANITGKKSGSGTALSKAFSSLCPRIALGFQESDLADDSCVKVEVQVDDKRSSNWNSGAKHEAGYDAFMTGSIFAQLCSNFGVDPERLLDDEKLRKYVNQLHFQLYFSFKSTDIFDLRTGKISEESLFQNKLQGKVSFDNTVILWGFPLHMKANEIREC